jgi:hypothetical protein
MTKHMASQFPGTCKACGCSFPAGTSIVWAPGAGARHADLQACEAAKAERASAASVPGPDLTKVAKFLSDARDRGLKFPKVRFLAPGGKGELRLHLAGPTSGSPGAVQIKLDGRWIGRVDLDGSLNGSFLKGSEPILLALAKIGEDPAKAAKEYAALMCRCSFCGLALTDEGSVEVGYGPICAKHWGLPHVYVGTPAIGVAPVDYDPRDCTKHEHDEKNGCILP